jgi:hypothetical protein
MTWLTSASCSLPKLNRSSGSRPQLRPAASRNPEPTGVTADRGRASGRTVSKWWCGRTNSPLGIDARCRYGASANAQWARLPCRPSPPVASVGHFMADHLDSAASPFTFGWRRRTKSDPMSGAATPKNPNGRKSASVCAALRLVEIDRAASSRTLCRRGHLRVAVARRRGRR